MLMPSKVKYRKQQRGRMRGKAWRGSRLSFGDYGLKVLEPGWITDRQIEASRVAIMRFIKRGGKLWIRIFPDKPVTKKPAETRMGKGKGAPEFWVAVVKPGRILFEMEGVPEAEAREAMRLAGHKLALPTQFVTRKIGAIRAGRGGRGTPWHARTTREMVMKLEKDKKWKWPAEKMREWTDDEVKARTTEFTGQLGRLRFRMASGQAESLETLRALRKGIARVKTVARERQLKAKGAA